MQTLLAFYLFFSLPLRDPHIPASERNMSHLGANINNLNSSITNIQSTTSNFQAPASSFRDFVIGLHASSAEVNATMTDIMSNYEADRRQRAALQRELENVQPRISYHELNPPNEQGERIEAIDRRASLDSNESDLDSVTSDSEVDWRYFGSIGPHTLNGRHEPRIQALNYELERRYRGLVPPVPLNDQPNLRGEGLRIIYDANGQVCFHTVEQLIAKFESAAEGSLEEPMCPCCYVEYGRRAADDVEPEHPVKTRCGHIFGDQCLKKWLPNNSCPTCRRVLFDTPGFGSNWTRRFRTLLDFTSETDDPLMEHIEGPQDRLTLPLDVAYTRAYAEPLGPSEIQPRPEDGWLEAEDPVQLGLRRPNPEGQHLATEPEIENSDAGWTFTQDVENNEDDHLFLFDEVRRVVDRREAMLYQALVDEGTTLPSPRSFGAELSGTLDWVQERALFQEIQRRGAFDYPGLRRFYNPMRDVQIFRELRDYGCCWNPNGFWGLSNGTILWNLEGNGTKQTSHPPRQHEVAGTDTADGENSQDRSAGESGVAFDILARGINTWDLSGAPPAESWTVSSE